MVLSGFKVVRELIVFFFWEFDGVGGRKRCLLVVFLVVVSIIYKVEVCFL